MYGNIIAGAFMFTKDFLIFSSRSAFNSNVPTDKINRLKYLSDDNLIS
jgi:hypothetical protein